VPNKVVVIIKIKNDISEVSSLPPWYRNLRRGVIKKLDEVVDGLFENDGVVNT
jgi:hypothetical protein